MGHLDNGPDVRLDPLVLTGPEPADVDDHVELGRAVGHGAPASKTLVSVVFDPCGKPMTVPTTTPDPASRSRHIGTSAGRAQTDATSYRAATAQPSITSSSVSSGRSSEWSMVLATRSYVRSSIVRVSMTPMMAGSGANV